MNHFYKSAGSLLLAVLLLLGAAGVSFSLVFGLPAYAAEGGASSEGQSASEPSSRAEEEPAAPAAPAATAVDWGTPELVEIRADEKSLLTDSIPKGTISTLNIFIRHENASGISKEDLLDSATTVSVTFNDNNFEDSKKPIQIIDDSVKVDENTKVLEYTIQLEDVPYNAVDQTLDCSISIQSPILLPGANYKITKTLASSAGSEASSDCELISYAFYRANDQLVSKVTRGNYEYLELNIHDAGIDIDEFKKDIKHQISWKINSDVFEVRGNANGDKHEVSKNSKASDGGVLYTLRLYNVYYSGISNRLKLYINYGENYTERILNETLTECEIYEAPPRDDSHKDDDDDDSSSRADIAPPTPNIIVAEYSYGNGSVSAASSFALDLTIRNTSKKLPIDNIVMKVALPEALTMTSSSNTFYIDMMPKDSTVKRTVNLSVKPNAEPISHAVKLSFSFEAVIDETRKQFTSEEEISIPVSQLDRFSLNTIEVPSEIYVGEDASFEVSFINKGKTPVYNITAEITGNIAQPGQRQFLGNLESGSEDSADFILGALESGVVQGEVVITYEDANMNVSELRSPFQANAIALEMPPMEGGMETMNPEDMAPEQQPWYLFYQKIPPWGWVAGGVVGIILLAYIIKLIRHHRDKKLLEQEDDDEDL